jgi:hypothetical protein
MENRRQRIIYHARVVGIGRDCQKKWKGYLMAEQRLEFADHLMGMLFDPRHHCKYCEDE